MINRASLAAHLIPVTGVITFTTKTKVKLIDSFAWLEVRGDSSGGGSHWTETLHHHPDDSFHMLISLFSSYCLCSGCLWACTPTPLRCELNKMAATRCQNISSRHLRDTALEKHKYSDAKREWIWDWLFLSLQSALRCFVHAALPSPENLVQHIPPSLISVSFPCVALLTVPVILSALHPMSTLGNNQLTDVGWKALCSSSHGLRRLHAAECSRMTDASLKSMANLKNLQHLDISLCDKSVCLLLP